MAVKPPPELLRAHDLEVRRSMPLSAEPHLYGCELGHVEPAKYGVCEAALTARGVYARPTGSRGHWRPLSTLALCDARPLLDALQSEVHRGEHA